MSAKSRKHAATGKKPPGGKRPGAGRPKGVDNALPYGTVQALKALRLRVPESAAPEAAELAGRAFERVIDVMEEKVGPALAGQVLKAATLLREEICGQVTQKVEHSGTLTLEQLVAASMAPGPEQASPEGGAQQLAPASEGEPNPFASTDEGAGQ